MNCCDRCECCVSVCEYVLGFGDDREVFTLCLDCFDHYSHLEVREDDDTDDDTDEDEEYENEDPIELVHSDAEEISDDPQ